MMFSLGMFPAQATRRLARTDRLTLLLAAAIAITLAAHAEAQTAGQLDTTFGGGDGMVTTTFYPGTNTDERAYGVAIQNDGKIVVAGTAGGNFAVARYNADGSLDTTFGTGGKVLTLFSRKGGGATAWAVLIQADGKIVAVGGFNGDFALARYNPNGTLDATFGNSGKVTTDFGSVPTGRKSSNDSAHAAAIDANGNIYAVGGSSTGGWAIAKYTPSGALDKSFDGDGLATPGIGTGASGVALQLDNGLLKIVVSGTFSGTSASEGIALVRLNPNGAIDTTFGLPGGSGIVYIPFPGGGWVNGMAVDGAGRFVVSAMPSSPSTVGGDHAVARVNPNGTVDTAFGYNGLAVVNMDSYGALCAVAGQSDGKVVLATTVHNWLTDRDNFGIARFDDFGNLDTTFGTGGLAMAYFGAGTYNDGDGAFAVAIQPDGKIVAAGITNTGSTAETSNHDFALARFWGN